MATDAQSLITQAAPYMGMGVSIAMGIKLSLLAQIALAHNPAANVTPAALLTSAKCFNCFSNADLGMMMELALLAIIAT